MLIILVSYVLGFVAAWSFWMAASALEPGTGQPGVVLLFGGCKDPDDLALFATLIGERPEQSHTWNADGQITATTTRMVPVITAPMLAGLPNHRALLVRRGMPVALANTPIAWKRRDVRRATRQVALHQK